MNGCPDCTPDAPCRWWCPVDLKHHPVANMVDYCIEKATDPKLKSVS